MQDHLLWFKHSKIISWLRLYREVNLIALVITHLLLFCCAASSLPLKNKLTFEGIYEAICPYITNLWWRRDFLRKVFQYIKVFFKSFFEITYISSYDKRGRLEEAGDSRNFFLREYLSLVWKKSVTHMHDLVVYVKKDFLLYGSSPWKTLKILIYVFNWIYFIRCRAAFSSVNNCPFLFFAVFDAISSTIMRFSQ